jgi:hypothetical protein
MQPQTLESIASAAEVFSDARRQLQAAVDAASDLGLVVPNSFPDAMEHLRDWIANAETEVRELLNGAIPIPTGLDCHSASQCVWDWANDPEART